MALDRVALRRFADETRPRYEEQLRQLVEIPSVSADPERAADVRRAAEVAASLLRAKGAEVQIVETSGGPLVVGDFPALGAAPTVMIYNHLDVQPADKEAEGWRTEPFSFVRQGDRYFGRGTTDDKGPALAALHGVLAARGMGVPTGVRFFWETEEETGSPSLEESLARLSPGPRLHSVVVSDTSWLGRRNPTSTAGLRGFVGFRFTLETGGADAHSGDVGGGARNPLAELMQVASEIADARTGRVKVPGFYDDVRPLTRAEREDYRRCGFSLRSFARDYQLRKLRTDDPLDFMVRIWSRPTFEVHGLVGGYAGPGLKAIVPGRAELKATCRVVPRQKPARVAALVRAFVRKRHPDVKVEVLGMADAFEGETTGPVAEAVQEALSFGFGLKAAFVREGGTIGGMAAMQRRLRCPVAFLGLSLPEHGYHAPNENFDWGQASGGMAAFARYLDVISGNPAGPGRSR